MLKESVDIHHAMQDPDDLNAAANRPIKNQVLADWKTLQTRMEFIPVSTHIREPSELPACFLNVVKECVRILDCLELYTTRCRQGRVQPQGA